MSNKAWSLNATPASQLQAALAALGTATWQLQNFFHDANPSNYLPHDTFEQDANQINSALDLAKQAFALLSEVQGMVPELDPMYITATLPVIAQLKPCEPSEIDLANYRSALDDLDNNS